MTKTEQKILDAAAEILKYDLSASLDSIATAAGVSRRTLYRYYPNKESLLESLVLAFSNKSKQRIEQFDATDPDVISKLKNLLKSDIDEGILSGLLLFFNKQKYTHKHLNPDNDGENDEEFEKLSLFFRERIDQLRDKGIVAEWISTDAFIYIMLGIIFGATRALEDGVVARKDMYEIAWKVITQGFINPEKKEEDK